MITSRFDRIDQEICNTMCDLGREAKFEAIVKNLNMSRSTVSIHLRKLGKSGQVKRVKKPRGSFMTSSTYVLADNYTKGEYEEGYLLIHASIVEVWLEVLSLILAIGIALGATLVTAIFLGIITMIAPRRKIQYFLGIFKKT